MYDKPFYRVGSGDTKCLSMWQPWASLLIWGFKRFEGRSWDTNYRGPLWIHAGAKEPDPELVKNIETQYRRLYDGVDLPPFPSSYPTGCLLGVIDLQDVIDQKVYTEYIPKKFTGESTEPFLFVVRNPRRLMVNIRALGSRGIFDVDENLVSASVNTLKKVPTGWFPYYADNLPAPVPVDDSEPKQEETAEETVKIASKKPQESQINSKSSFEVESFGGGQLRIVGLGNQLEAKTEDFVKQFERFIGKKLEKGKDGVIGTTIDKFIPAYATIKEVIQQLTREMFSMKDLVDSALVKKVDLFSVDKNTKRFDFTEQY